MNRFRKKIKNRAKRRLSVKKSIGVNNLKPRVTVFRSNKYLYAQIVDDITSKTLASYTDASKAGIKGVKKVDSAMKVGEELGKKAIKAKVEAVVFDRNGYKYHGRIKSFADGLRKSGLKF